MTTPTLLTTPQAANLALPFVPSAAIPGGLENIVLLNPEHPGSRKLELLSIERDIFNKRAFLFWNRGSDQSNLVEPVCSTTLTPTYCLQCLFSHKKAFSNAEKKLIHSDFSKQNQMLICGYTGPTPCIPCIHG